MDDCIDILKKWGDVIIGDIIDFNSLKFVPVGGEGGFDVINFGTASCSVTPDPLSIDLKSTARSFTLGLGNLSEGAYG